MKYCSTCASPVVLRVPPGDERERHVCNACGEIFYQNPRIVTGCIPEWGQQILLCKRAIEPRYGFWTLPAGFMENGETTQQGAARETLEEAHARVEVGDMFSYVNVPIISQVHILFRARLLDLDFSAGTESLDVRLMNEDEIPWDDIAFPSVERSLRLFFADRAAGAYSLHSVDIYRRAGQPPGATDDS